MKTLSRSIAAAAALMLAACAPGLSSDGAASPNDRDTLPLVTVQNNNWSDMVVYMVRGTMRVRLGMVTSMHTEQFRMPRSFTGSAGQMRLMADPIGSNRTYVSEVLDFRPGQSFALQVGHNIDISFVSVRN